MFKLPGWIWSFFMLVFLAACAGGLSVMSTDPTETGQLPQTELPTTVADMRPTSTISATISLTSEVDRYAFDQNARLGRGVNLGNALEAPVEGEWGVTLEEGYFDLIQAAGFNSVRVPIRWNAHAGESAPYPIDEAFFERVDWVVEQASRRNLAVVLNIHNYDDLMANPRQQEERFLAIWDQIAQHYKDAPSSVFFELLNEPNGTINPLWNQLIADVIPVIRRSNPQRTIILGPANWNSISNLYTLKLPPDDRNLIITVHYYLPFEFTHQGAEWVDGADAYLGTKWTGSSSEKKAVDFDLDIAAAWGAQNQRPIYLGEFGAYSKAEIGSRHLWTDHVARAAEERGFSWAYWEFCAGFGVYDSTKSIWNQPILTALIP
jgi:endoglucanase